VLVHPPLSEAPRLALKSAMGKNSATFVCQSCGAVYNRWKGKCEACGGWNSVVEETEACTISPRKVSRPGHSGRNGVWS